MLAILIDSDIWYTVSGGKLTYTETHADDKEVACKTKAEKLTSEEDIEIKPVEIVTLNEADHSRTIWIVARTKKKLYELVSYFLTLTVNNEFWLYETETRKAMKLTDYARVKHINSSMWKYNVP